MTTIVLERQPLQSAFTVAPEREQANTILQLHKIAKSYDHKSMVLNDINLSLQEGEFVSIIGQSGAGKSTLLRCINRMIEPSKGEIIFDQQDITSINKRAMRQQRAKMGMIFQHYNLVSRLTVFENVLHGRFGYKSTMQGILSIYTEEEKRLALSILEKLNMKDQIYKRCDQLSGGQKQRVGIARALVQEPKLLLCDEPIASLDPNSSKVIMDHLKEISQSMGITVLVNLHQVDVAMRYSDRIIGLRKGEKVFDDIPKQLNQLAIRNIYGTSVDELITE
ncbi:phosphonate ABC transporter ATP-binding protein [Lysinibacillus sphaericus]|uniref:Phosphonate ABC transporter ATP-binding protein n=1 Tax=Lysinibacillus sphaericus TaxID=1421 RepID=A0A2S0JZN5_LYSSH|nr:phosphonate ABC transporter ATP-binding protein [Lysinibacillus sphaericus]AVK96610.1 phosphonate ABC transporter ATP-binding protein [Lysinibacillus sphaericus]MED4542859.1 phosphonate ABC transporter ATP-binding protein [Lysinibacillus sphaericus]TKI19852.1 phosphonate ABC transporter ATP-binding protein [Lysinibacillus sphaericus]SUV17591.1 phosphonate ABC transporter ATPase [Lysinibacillus sphaericus]GEC83470.1 phosphonates import ATP-binding protein PhnC [Lysinibacillus sphaericus]